MIYFISLGLIFALIKGNPLFMLDKIKLKCVWLFIFVFGVELIIYIWFQNIAREYPIVLEVLFCAMVIGLWINRKIIGIPLILFGAAINLFAIILHGGLMPVSAKALELAQLHIAVDDARHQTLSEGHYWWLGDWIPLYKKVISTGDLFIGTGVILFMVIHTPKRGKHEREE